VGDLDRQPSVAQAANGCFLAVLALMIITVGVALVAITSPVLPLLAALLILSGVGLAVVAWAERDT
jgi:hypothetical protein